MEKIENSIRIKNDSILGISIIIIAFLSIRLFALFKFHEFFWDESVYIGIGKYIFSAGTVGLWETIRPPVLPVMLGFLWKLGLDITVWSEVIMVLFSMGLLLITYRIARHYMTASYAAASVFILAITPIFFGFSSRVMTGIPGTFFAMLALYYYLKRRHLFLVGVAAGFAMLTRFPLLLMIVAVAMLMAVDWFIKHVQTRRSIVTRKIVEARKRNLLKGATSFSAGILLLLTPYLIFNLVYYSDSASNAIHAAFRPFFLAFQHQSNVHESVFGSMQNLMFYPAGIFIDNPLYALSLIGILASVYIIFIREGSRISFMKSGISYSENYMRHLTLLVPLILLLAYFTFIVNKQLRFSIAFLPILAIYSGYGLMVLLRSLRISIDRVWLKNALIVMIFLAAIPPLALVMTGDVQIYHYLPESMPLPIEDLCIGRVSGMPSPILTSDPTCMAYVDVLMVPYYQDLVEGPAVYDQWLPRSASLIYHTGIYPCMDGDMDCYRQNDIFFNRIKDENMMTGKMDFYGTEYYFFATLFM